MKFLWLELEVLIASPRVEKDLVFADRASWALAQDNGGVQIPGAAQK